MKQIKKRCSVLLMTLTLMLASCSAAGENKTEEPVKEEPLQEETFSWEDYYDQAIDYFSQERYEEAIEAFTMAIETDPEHAPVYVGRGDCYVIKKAESDDEAEGNLSLAINDYETAIKIDETYAPAYLGKADVLIRQGEFEEAYNLLTSSEDLAAESAAIVEKVQEIESGKYIDSSNQIRRFDHFDTAGNLIGYQIYDYDFLGRKCSWQNYFDTDDDEHNGITIGLHDYCIVAFGENGLPERNNYYNPKGDLSSYQTMEYDERGLETRRDVYTSDDVHRAYYLTYYDENGRETGYDAFEADGTMFAYYRYEYDENGKLVLENRYAPDGTLLGTQRPSDE